MSATQAQVTIPTGTWEVDPSHSTVGFTVRHLVVSKVRGGFGQYQATINIADNPLQSSVSATIDAASIDTRDENRDVHLKGPDFFDVEKYPTLKFESTAVRQASDGYEVDGNLTIRDVTRPVTLTLEFAGVQNDPWGGTRAGFEAFTKINRRDFGLTWNAAIEGGGFVVGDSINIELFVEALKK
jgi:polyisoprenoid-binding protein YceI